MNRRTSLFCTVLLGLAAATPAGAAGQSDLLWLSDTPPKRTRPAADAGYGRHGDGMATAAPGEEGAGLGGSVKRLWLRQGDDPVGAAYLGPEAAAGPIRLLDAKGRQAQAPLSSSGGLAQVRHELADLGFSNAYLTRTAVRDAVLRVQVAKAELLRGTCCAKRDQIDPDQLRAIVDPAQPLEVVREHEADERLLTRIVSGDRIVFTIYRQGRPLPGARVTMLTQEGWQKRLVSDRNGQAAFTVIRDYFAAWSEFRRSRKATFLVLAETEEERAGVHAGQAYARVAYQATLSGRYQVSPYDYKSYAWGLGLVVFVSAFGGLAVYLYRRRRQRPFQEVRFDERA